MAIPNKISIGRTFALIGVITLTIITLGATLYFQGIATIQWWIPILICAILAAASGFGLWKIWSRLTSTQSFLPNFICNLIFVTFLLSAIYYTLNYTIPISTSKENVEVVSKFQERHYRSERVGKNSYKRGAPYYTYHIRIKLPSNREKNLELPHSTYKRIKSGEEIKLTFSKGCLGATMIHTSTLLKNNPQLSAPKEKRKRCRFFGTHT